MSHTIKVSAITTLHEESILQWKTDGVDYKQKDFYRLVEENHAFNYQLWHTEDKARRDDMGYEFVYQAKRKIDKYNQARNNRMEAIDEWFAHLLQPENAKSCPVNSESPGMIVDRLSILSLKSYHMKEQAERQDATEAHQKHCFNKLIIIRQQLEQLALCLSQLIDDVHAKQRTFKIYHQFKMYNDPNLNPELYSRDSRED